VPEVAPLHPSAARYDGGLREVAPGVHAWLQPNGSWGESNAALVVGEGASLLVDTLWDVRLTARMLAAMAPLLRTAPIATVVNTHSDGDHWWGNQLVAHAEIVATEAAAAVMAHQSPSEMRRFGAVGAALRVAGRVPIGYPRRDDLATMGAFVGEVLRPFAFAEVRLTVQRARSAASLRSTSAGARSASSRSGRRIRPATSSSRFPTPAP
jgi:cyclase